MDSKQLEMFGVYSRLSLDKHFYSGHRDTFWTINSVSGEIFANQNLISKSLQTSNHKFVLIVRAQDGGSEPLSSTAQVHIDVVRDKNVSPQFIQRNVSLSIPENASPKR